HLLPGNHDPDRPGGTWERLLRQGVLPEHIRVHREPCPVELETGVWLLPAPLRRRAEGADPTAWMETAATPAGALRIGLAHGSISG
ncbi:MAG: DNA repair exonuclease, partial [Chloroflexota bacterium]|nr:DNA repair exonuclease [Chloroflexota bacterium]